MKKMLGTGALLLLIIYLLPVGYRVYAGGSGTGGAKDMLSVHAEMDESSGNGEENGNVNVNGNGAVVVGGSGTAGGALPASGQVSGSDTGNPYDNINNAGTGVQAGASGTGWGAGGTSSVWSTAGTTGSVRTGSVQSGGAQGGGSAGLAAGVDINSEGREVAAGGEIAVLTGGEVRTMPLETYVEGVVAAEISPDFPEEAIRAQAVAARTYAVYKAKAGRPMQHRDADVCDDYTHCAAYIDLAAAASGRWGEDAGTNTGIIRKAVQDTAGEIVTKDREPIVAVFHAASAARTESAKDIWGTDIPYLQSVASPGGSACSKYEGTVRMTFDEFRAKIRESYPEADLSGDPKRWFSASTRSGAGSVIVCTMGGVQVRGTDLRTVLGLNSANFSLTIDENSISFHTVGYGHGVGLSQYGAKYLAEQGSTYQDILTHYYTGTEIAKMSA